MLGLINFYHSFIPDAAQLLSPLTSMLSTARSTNSNIKLTWTNDAREAFNKSKSLLSEKTILHYSDPHAETSVAVDASDIAVAGVLQQRKNGIWEPISFFSRKLNNAQKKYSTFSKELLAIYLSLKHFRHFVEGSTFYILTDHQPILRALHKKSARDLPREERWLEFISIFTTDIRHIKGSHNIVADALSRHLDNVKEQPTETVSSLFLEPDSHIHLAQAEDQELQDILNGTVACTPILTKTDGLYYHQLGHYSRLYIPSKMRHEIFSSYHNLAHPGIRATTNYLTRKYFWPGMNKNIRQWTRTCIDCQRAKVVRHNSAPIHTIPPSSSKFTNIHLDIVGPLPVNRNCKYLLTVIDRFSRWTEAIPLYDITADTVAHNFLLHWVARFGVPETLTTDRGAQFESGLWKSLLHTMGTTKIRTTSYHPQSNGLIERFHRRLKDSIRAHADTNAQTWIDKLPFIMLSIRSSLRDDYPFSPAQTVYGTELTLPSDLILPYNQSNTTNITDYTNNLCQFMKFVPPVIGP